MGYAIKLVGALTINTMLMFWFGHEVGVNEARKSAIKKIDSDNKKNATITQDGKA